MEGRENQREGETQRAREEKPMRGGAKARGPETVGQTDTSGHTGAG